MALDATLNPDAVNVAQAEQQTSVSRTAVNVGIGERAASIAAGAALIAWGMRKLSLAGVAGMAAGAELIRRGVSGRSMLYRAAGMNTAISRKSGAEISAAAPEIERSITINRPPEELYNFWRDPANMARAVAHFAEVTPTGDGLTHWRIRGPLGQVFEWDRRDREVEPGRELAWQSLPGGSLPNRGVVTFRPGPDETGTEVRTRIQFEPPLGVAGAAVAKRLHKIQRAIAGKTLRRFKALAETGEIPTLARNPSGRGTSDVF